MFDIILESVRFILTALLLVFLLRAGRTEGIGRQSGWRYILAGFCVLLLGMAIDVTDNFPELNRFVIIGDTVYQAFIEKVVGYLMGFVLLAIGFWKWMPTVIELKRARAQLQKSHEGLEQLMQERTGELSRELESRKRIQQELQGKRSFLKSVLHGIQDGILVLDRELTILDFNPALKQIIPDKTPVIGRPCYEVYHQRRTPCDDCLAVETLRTGRKHNKNIKYEKPGGAQGWLHVSAFLMTDAGTGRTIGVIEYVRDITEAILAERRLKETLREKDFLLKEVHHRVKNNMALISSLLSLQATYSQAMTAHDDFQQCQGRIKAMALVHERLYRNGNLTMINLSEYVQGLVDIVRQSYSTPDRAFDLNLEIEPLDLDMDTLIPLGLLLNELLVNSIKHAFRSGGDNSIWISINTHASGVSFSYSDNGCGLPPEISLEYSPSLGMKLIDNLIQQLEGRCIIKRMGGTTYEIEFSPGGQFEGAGHIELATRPHGVQPN